MTTHTWKKDSWHYRLATVYGNLPKWSTSTDICTYTRNVLIGIALALVVVVLGSLLSAFILAPIGALIVGYFSGWDIVFNSTYDVLSCAGAAIYAIVFAAVLIYFFGKGLFKTSDSMSNTFVFQAIKAKVNKVCFKINFT